MIRPCLVYRQVGLTIIRKDSDTRRQTTLTMSYIKVTTVRVNSCQMLLFISDAHMQVRELYKTSISLRQRREEELMLNLDGNILAWCHPLGQKQEKWF